MFGSTAAESLRKASSLVLRIGTDAHLYDDADDVSIAPLLDSRFDSDNVEALKRLLALIAQGSDVSSLFPQCHQIFTYRSIDRPIVVKNVASHSVEVKKLVYRYYLLHYAENSNLYQTRALKLEILSTIATDSSIQIILEEFQDYIKDPDKRFVADTVAAIGLCAQRLPSVADVCLEGLLALTVQESCTVNSGEMEHPAGVMVEAIMSIKAIVKQNPVYHEKKNKLIFLPRV